MRAQTLLQQLSVLTRRCTMRGDQIARKHKQWRTNGWLLGRQPPLCRILRRHIHNSPCAHNDTVRQQVLLDEDGSTDGPFVSVVATADQCRLVGLLTDDHLAQFYNCVYVSRDRNQALYFASKFVEQDQLREFFVFSHGAVVFWNVSEIEQKQILERVKRREQKSYSQRLIAHETDRIPFEFSDSHKSKIRDDKIFLNTSVFADGAKSDDSKLERFAFSHGLAASAKLGVWESELDHISKPLLTLATDLEKGDVKISKKQALQQCGALQRLRHKVNLNSDIFDSDVYWDNSELEEHYIEMMKYLSVFQRQRTVNTQLDYCLESVSTVDKLLEHHQSVRLEWLIIILIAIEILFDVADWVDRKWPTQQHSNGVAS